MRLVEVRPVQPPPRPEGAPPALLLTEPQVRGRPRNGRRTRPQTQEKEIMTTAAIYARKSTDDSDRDAANKSVTRQVEHAKAYAASKGWAVPDEFIFIDDGISGAEFKNRP